MNRNSEQYEYLLSLARQVNEELDKINALFGNDSAKLEQDKNAQPQ